MVSTALSEKTSVILRFVDDATSRPRESSREWSRKCSNGAKQLPPNSLIGQLLTDDIRAHEPTPAPPQPSASSVLADVLIIRKANTVYAVRPTPQRLQELQEVIELRDDFDPTVDFWWERKKSKNADAVSYKWITAEER